MKAADLREATIEDLRQKERELDDQIFRVRIQKSMGQIEAAGKVRGLRRDRARVKTVLRDRRLAAAATGNEDK